MHNKEQPITFLCIFISIGVMILSGAIQEELLGPEEFRDGIELLFGVIIFFLMFSGVPIAILCSTYRKATIPLLIAVIISAIVTILLIYVRTMLYFVFCPILTTIIFSRIVKNCRKYDESKYMNNSQSLDSHNFNANTQWDSSSWDSPNSGTEYNYNDDFDNPIK